MESGARAAISGFRLQALYTLDLILRESASAREFQPEGKEDLAVYENGRLIRVIQVKAYSAPLALSDLAPRKEGSLLRRLVNSEADSSVLELASFGPLGPELEGVQRHEVEALGKLSGKLKEYGYLTGEIGEIVRRLKVVRVEEAAVRDRVYRFLTQTMTAGDPERAFDLLVWWILQAAENRHRITFRSLREQLLAVGKYFAERSAHQDEWFTTIKPLEEWVDYQAPSAEALAEEYYRGTAARYSHICAGLDVRRSEHLHAIDSYFAQNKKVVILHGASGQGKTSLALRYLHDYVPSDWRFMVSSIDNRRHAAKIANALADHLRVVNARVWLFIDVAPRDLQWVSLVQELLDIENIRLLVAIREEDLARKTSSESEIGFPADIRLEFSEHDAASVYAQLIERGNAINAFPTFAEAWERFGEGGPLLEFVYLVTQTESLISVLASQVRRLREEIRSGALEQAALQFLHICAIATSFEARVNLAPLAAHLNLKDPVGTVALFENEFLLRVSKDRTQVEALHPVRSDLLARVLQDPAFAPAEKVAIQGLAYIPEADLEVFLLYMLSRMSNGWVGLREYLSGWEPKTWTGAAGIGRALLWWGIKSYLEENRETIETARQVGGNEWAMLILADVAGAGDSDIGETILKLREEVNPGSTEDLRRVRGSLTPQRNVFKPLSDWLARINIIEEPFDLVDWEGFAELTFWAGHLGFPLPSLNLTDLPVTRLPIGTLAQVCLALAEANPEKASELLQLHGDTLHTRFREETDSFTLREDERAVAVDFIVPFDLLSRRQEVNSEHYEPGRSRSFGEERSTQEVDDAREDRISRVLNSEAVRRVELLRGLFPCKERYCTQGHGHQVNYQGIKLPHDNTTKRMPPTAVPIPWLVRVNSTLHSLEDYRCRPKTWKQFAQLLLGIREILANTLLQLHRALVAYFEGGSARSLFGGTLSLELWNQAKQAIATSLCLPVSAVDEWGLSNESRQIPVKEAEFSANIASTFALRRSRLFLEAVHNYRFSLSNFFNQAEIICIVHGLIGRNPLRRDQVLSLAVKEYNYDEAKIRLSKYNLFQAMLCLEKMQLAFDCRLGNLVDASQLARVKKRERNLFPELWAMWYQFCHFPEKRMQSAAVQSLSAMENTLSPFREELRDSIVSDTWRASVIRENFPWEDRPALVLRLEIASIEDLEIARAGIIARLNEMLAGAEIGSLLKYASEWRWSYILIIPVISNVALDFGAWVIPAYVFSGSDGQTGADSPLLRPLHALPRAQIEEFGIDINPVLDIEVFDEMVKKFGYLYLQFAHLALLAGQLKELDEVGRRILERYLEKAGRQLSQGLEGIPELIGEVRDYVEKSATGNQVVSELLLQPLERLREELESFGDQKVVIKLSECEARAEQFQQLMGFVSTLRLMMIPGVVRMESYGSGDVGPRKGDSAE